MSQNFFLRRSPIFHNSFIERILHLIKTAVEDNEKCGGRQRKKLRRGGVLVKGGTSDGQITN